MNHEKFNSLVSRIKKNTDWFEEFIELVKEYYKTNPAGGCLNSVLDAGNICIVDIHWHAGYASGSNDDAANGIANLMLFMTYNQRKKVIRSYRY